jgi:hypothetical protein
MLSEERSNSIPDKNIGDFEPKPMTDIHGFIAAFIQKWKKVFFWQKGDGEGSSVFALSVYEKLSASS